MFYTDKNERFTIDLIRNITKTINYRRERHEISFYTIYICIILNIHGIVSHTDFYCKLMAIR